MPTSCGSPVNVPMTMRLDTPPFDDDRVRQAFRLAADRPQLVETAYLGYGDIGNDLLGKGWPSYNSELPQREYDPERAKSLLREAGYDELNVTLGTSKNSPVMEESATVYKQQAAAAGINVDLKVIPPDQYFGPRTYLSTNYPFYQSAWLNPFEDWAPVSLLESSPWNETAWSDPSWEQDFVKAQAIVDPAERNAAYWELQVPLYERGGYIVWGFSDLVDGVSPQLQGVVPSPLYYLGNYAFKDWWLAS